MPIFRPKPPINREEYEWLLACFAWLRTVLDDAHIQPDFVLPTHPTLRATRTGPQLFKAVQHLMGMGDWPCRLEMVDIDQPEGEETANPQHMTACGTFSIEGEEAVIRYSSPMLRDPDALAGTFAHELCHYLLMNAGDPPGGPDLMEHSTDCAAVYCGFGVLLANSARTYEQWSDGQWMGWSSFARGYLSEQSLVTATALFAAMHGYDWREANGTLKSYLQSDMKKAAKAIAHDHPDISASLDRVDLLEWNYG